MKVATRVDSLNDPKLHLQSTERLRGNPFGLIEDRSEV